MQPTHSPWRERAAVAVVALATLLLVSQHWGMMLSNSDDPWLARASWSEVEAFASSQKRYWMLIINFLTTLPYQLGGWSTISFVKIVVNTATLITFFLFLQRLVNRFFALLCVVVWLALSDVSKGDYSAFHGYLLMFNLPMCLLFLSLWWYTRCLDAQRTGFKLLGPYALFGLALLGYEPMIFFSLAYPCIALYRYPWQSANSQSHKRFIDTAQTLLRFAKHWATTNGWFFVIIAVHIGCYFSYRRYLGDSSGGLLNVGDDVGTVFKTMFRFSLYGFRAELQSPGEYLFNLSHPAIGITGLIYGACIASGAWLLLPLTGRSQQETMLQTGWALALLAIITLSLNALHALTPGYRQWAMDNPYYVGNYLSSFTLAILIGVALMSLVGGVNAKHERWLLAIVVALLTNSAASNMIKWATLAERNRQDAQLWHQAIAELKQGTSKAPAQSTMVCATHAPEKVSGDDRFWSYELSRQLGRSVVYHSKHFSQLTCDAHLDFDDYRLPKIR